MSRALITGATGQDGSYLGERLVAEGLEVHALVLPGATPPAAAWAGAVHWHPGDLADTTGLEALVAEVAPHEVYNLGGQSSVARSWADPVETARTTGLGAVALMEAARRLQERSGEPVRFVQASSAEIFGSPGTSPQDEATPVAPVSPYGAAKAHAHQMASVLRSRGLGVSSVILYNHESPRRPTTFVTRKITHTAAAIARGRADELVLGNLDAERDWGWAPDYVDALVRAVRAPVADDFVVATGEAHSVREFVAAAFAEAGVDDWGRFVRVDPALVRPADPARLCGDAGKARRELGWAPTLSFAEMVGALMRADLDALRT